MIGRLLIWGSLSRLSVDHRYHGKRWANGVAYQLCHLLASSCRGMPSPVGNILLLLLLPAPLMCLKEQEQVPSRLSADILNWRRHSIQAPFHFLVSLLGHQVRFEALKNQTGPLSHICFATTLSSFGTNGYLNSCTHIHAAGHAQVIGSLYVKIGRASCRDRKSTR